MKNQRKDTAEKSFNDREIFHEAYREYMKFAPGVDANEQALQSFYDSMFGSYNQRKQEL